MYGELSFFEGYAFAHIAAWEHEVVLRRRRAKALEHRERRRGGRSRR